jgi:hypothetical protein
MASLEQIRTAIKTIVEAGTGLTVHDTVPDQITLPCAIILPQDGDFYKAFGRGHDTHNLDLFVMISRTVPRVGQNNLDAYVTGAGPGSIRATVFANRGLGLSDGTEANISGYSRYGGSFPAAGIDHIGAALRFVVTTPGTA